jgi:hypothetical protein
VRGHAAGRWRDHTGTATRSTDDKEGRGGCRARAVAELCRVKGKVGSFRDFMFCACQSATGRPSVEVNDSRHLRKTHRHMNKQQCAARGPRHHRPFRHNGAPSWCPRTRRRLLALLRARASGRARNAHRRLRWRALQRKRGVSLTVAVVVVGCRGQRAPRVLSAVWREETH